MKLRPEKRSMTSALLVTALLAGAGYSNPIPTAAAPDQVATRPTDSRFKPTVFSSAQRQAIANHTFVFKADKKLNSVSVVGSFNNWNKTANSMSVDADGVTWRTTLPLNLGRYVYKFVLFGPNNEERWVVDPRAPLDATDKVNSNSVVLVAPPDYNVAASPNDGQTAASALLGLSGVRDISYDNEKLTLSLRTRPNDLRQIYLKSAGRRYPMKVVRTDDLYAYYKASLPWDKKQDLTYSFELVDGNRTQEFGASGLNPKTQFFRIAAKTFQPYLLTDAPEPLKMSGPLTTQTVSGPAWAKNLPIYEVNLDVYGFPKGTALREFEKHLPVLKEMGVGLVWFMPLHPRGYKKGFGSPYSVRDYTDINPDLGTKAEFRHLVARAHALGLRVLMDWVPNHTAWDNAMIEAHPEFYVKDDKGEITQAYTWADTAQLDYGQSGKWNRALWNTMRDNMTMWVRDFDIDGFRADVAGSNGKVPVEFWQWLRPQLNAIKPVFMLAEADNTEIHSAFDMTYSWNLPPVLWDITAGRKPATAIDDELRKEARTYPDGAIRMRFLDNHDWHPHADWGWGDRPAIDPKGGRAVAPLMVLCATLPGKPLLYNGQEMSFLKVDPSPQAEASLKSPVWPFYRGLLQLFGSQPALSEGSFSKVSSNHDDKVYAFVRQRGLDRILVVVNLSDQAQTVTLSTASLSTPALSRPALSSASLSGSYRDWFTNRAVQLSASPSLKLAPWAYQVYVGRTK